MPPDCPGFLFLVLPTQNLECNRIWADVKECEDPKRVSAIDPQTFSYSALSSARLYITLKWVNVRTAISPNSILCSLLYISWSLPSDYPISVRTSPNCGAISNTNPTLRSPSVSPSEPQKNMPSSPTLSSKTHQYTRYYVCKRHLKYRRTTTSSYIRTYGMCPCYIRCDGSHDSAWYICVDKRGNGRCDDPVCNHFYLNNEQGYTDADGYCYYMDDEPMNSLEGAQIHIPQPQSLISSKLLDYRRKMLTAQKASMSSETHAEDISTSSTASL